MTSTTPGKKVSKLLAALFWLALWQITAMVIGRPLFLASPLDTLKTLASLVTQGVFWLSIGTTFVRIAAGFVLGTLVGALLAILAARFSLAALLLSPAARVIKAVPVVSFIVLALIWIPSKNLSVFISFLMVLPIIYINTLDGIRCADRKLVEAARVFGTGARARLLYIYLPCALPQFMSGASVALGLCWKSGVAAEVIGLPANTIGERIYEAKLYLNTGELFAYTVVIVLISAVFERAVGALLRRGSEKIRGRSE